MAFAQLRRRHFRKDPDRQRDTQPMRRARENEHNALIAGSTAAIARSLDLLARTDHLPGMGGLTRRNRRESSRVP
jgi:hypothetical protein